LYAIKVGPGCYYRARVSLSLSCKIDLTAESGGLTVFCCIVDVCRVVMCTFINENLEKKNLHFGTFWGKDLV